MDVRLPPINSSEPHTYTEGEEVEVSTVWKLCKIVALFAHCLHGYVMSITIMIRNPGM